MGNLSVDDPFLPKYSLLKTIILFASADEAPATLVPCPSCGRKFREEALSRHLPICQKQKSKPKKVFDMKAKRIEAIVAENNVDNVQQVFNDKKAAEAPKKRASPTSEAPKKKSPDPPKPKKPAPLKRKPANAPRGGKPTPPPPKTPPPRTPKPAPQKKPVQPKVQTRQPLTPKKKPVADRSRTPMRTLPKKRTTPSPDVNGNSRKTPVRTPRSNAMRRAISSPNIDTNNNDNKKKESVMKFKEKFPNHSSKTPQSALTSVINKSHTNQIISIKKPRTVPGVRTGGMKEQELIESQALLPRPNSSIELDTGWDPNRLTEDYVKGLSTRNVAGSMTDLQTVPPASGTEVCTKCNSPFLLTSAKFCFNCGEKRADK